MMQLIGGRIAYHLIDDGLANILGLETLRHGTNPINRTSIKIFGGLIEHGGSTLGSTHNFRDDPGIKNAFYLFKDSAWSITDASTCNYFRYEILNYSVDYLTRNRLGNKILPVFHAFLSQKNLITNTVDSEKSLNTASGYLSKIARISSFACSFFAAIFTPTLKFRASIFDIEKNSNWENDKKYYGAAYRIKENVKPSQIGLIGTLNQGINSEIFARIKRNPAKCLTGVLQLAAGAAFVALAIQAACVTPQFAAGFAVANAILI